MLDMDEHIVFLQKEVYDLRCLLDELLNRTDKSVSEEIGFKIFDEIFL